MEAGAHGQVHAHEPDLARIQPHNMAGHPVLVVQLIVVDARLAEVLQAVQVQVEMMEELLLVSSLGV